MRNRRAATRWGWPAAAALLLAGCGAAAADQTPPTALVGVGQLPASVTDSTAPITPGGDPSPTDTGQRPPIEITTTTTAGGSVTIGQRARGNRVLMIGDSILASTSRRYSNDMCEAMVPLGWRVDIEAESGRPIGFGQQVLRRKWSQGWDAVMILLGNNYDGDLDGFTVKLNQLLDSVTGTPVLLSTVTPFEENRDQVNERITLVALSRADVSLLQWDLVSTDQADTVLGGDGLHLTDQGRRTLAAHTAAAFGSAPVSPGECMTSDYTNDADGPPVQGSSTPSSTRPGNASKRPSTTVRRATGTTQPGTTQPGSTSPSTSSPPGSSSPTTTPHSTVPGPPSTTRPSTTAAPPTTAPGTTAAPDQAAAQP